MLVPALNSIQLTVFVSVLCWLRVQKVPMSLLCNGDVDRPLRIEVLDFDKGGKHLPMGQVDTSVRELLESKGAPLSVIEPAKQAKKGDKYMNSGSLHASNCRIEENPTFTDVRSYCILPGWWCVLLYASCDLICPVLIPCASCRPLQFIAGGMHISLVVAIDFTASNGDVLNPSSLHYNR